MKKRTGRIIASSLFAFGIFLVASAVCIAVFIAVSLRSGAFRDDGTTAAPEPVSSETKEKPREEYLIDISEYEKYINPIGSRRNSFLTLVNGSSAGTEEKDLAALDSSFAKTSVLLHPYAAKALEAMLKEMEAENVPLVNPDTGLKLSVTAGFRDSDRYDEHITGLAVDMHNCTVSDVSFKNTDAFRWLEENCWKFGFIIRYPEGKAALTGVSFRPWQFRYVGRSHAKIIHENNLCLEEYLEGLK